LLDSRAITRDAATVLELTHADFHSHVEASATLVVEFMDSPSSPSDPHLLAERFPDVTFARVDPLREPDIARMFGLASAPALLIFREGIVLYFEAGEHSPHKIEDLLVRVSALDLGHVRAQIAKERAEAAVHMWRMCPAARRGPFPQ
jgi:thioredoxin 1